jgi:hypothetical protein
MTLQAVSAIGAAIEKMPGDSFGATVSFSHRGEGVAVWVGIGLAYGLGVGHNPPFCYAMKQMTLDDAYDWTPYSVDVEGRIPEDALSGRLVDVQVFISDSKPVVGQQPPNPWDVNGWIGEDVYSIGGLPPEYVLIQEDWFPFAYFYDGDVQVTTVTYRTDPFSPSAWNAERLAQSLKDQVETEGAHIIGLRVWADTTPLLWTDIRVEVTLVPPGGISIAAWPLILGILLVVLALIGLVIALTVLVDHIDRIVHPKPGLEDVKVSWTSVTLIPGIREAEQYFDRPLTPIAELEAMSDAELREYLDKIAEEEIRPSGGIPWWAWVAGGATVLGVGTLVYATRKKPKK